MKNYSLNIDGNTLKIGTSIYFYDKHKKRIVKTAIFAFGVHCFITDTILQGYHDKYAIFYPDELNEEWFLSEEECRNTFHIPPSTSEVVFYE